MQGKEKSKIKIRNFNKSLSIIDRINGHEINKVIKDINNTINHFNLSDISRILVQQQQNTQNFQVHMECLSR